MIKQSIILINKDTYFYAKPLVGAAELRGCSRKQARSGAGAAYFDPVEVYLLLHTTRINCTKMLIELEEWDSEGS